MDAARDGENGRPWGACSMSARRQQCFNFSHPVNRPESEWASIIAADPERYPAILQRAAAMALHQLSRPHATELCLLCERESRRNAA